MSNPTEPVMAEMRAQRELEQVRKDMKLLEMRLRVADQKVIDVEACVDLIVPPKAGLTVVDRVKQLVAQYEELRLSYAAVVDMRRDKEGQRARWEALADAVCKNISPTSAEAEEQAKAVAKYVDSLLAEAESRFGGVLKSPSEKLESASLEGSQGDSR